MTDLAQEIQVIVENILKGIGMTEITLTVTLKDNNVLHVDINTSDSALLIGYHGETLRALQFLVKAIARKSIEEEFSLSLDVEGYKEKYEEKLIEIAKAKAERVLSEDIRETLFPMNSYHRRMVHLYLAENFPDILTESIGEDPNRRIILKKK